MQTEAARLPSPQAAAVAVGAVADSSGFPRPPALHGASPSLCQRTQTHGHSPWLGCGYLCSAALQKTHKASKLSSAPRRDPGQAQPERHNQPHHSEGNPRKPPKQWKIGLGMGADSKISLGWFNERAALQQLQQQGRHSPKTQPSRPEPACTRHYSPLEIKITLTDTHPRDPPLLNLLLCISTSQNSPGQ